MQELIPETELKDAPFMSAKDKQLVLKQWTKFLAGGLEWQHFTKVLYEHLHLHCGFIAHYDRQGFYSTYFESGDGIIRFFAWLQYEENRHMMEYDDLFNAMMEVGASYIPGLIETAQVKQKNADIAIARRLLEKHGITLK